MKAKRTLSKGYLVLIVLFACAVLFAASSKNNSSDPEWKECGAAKGSERITLPEDWTELNIIAYAGINRSASNVSRISFDRFSSLRLITQLSPSGDSKAVIYVTETEVYIFSYYVNGTLTELTEGHGIIVNYR